MTRPKLKKNKSLYFLLLFIVTLILPLVWPTTTQAAAAQQVWLRLDRVAATTATGGMVCMKTNGADTGTEDGVQVVFPSDFTINETEANWSVTTSNLPTGATAWPSIAAPSGSGNYIADNTGKYVWFVGGDLAADTLYCFNFAASNTLTTPSAGDSKTGSINAKAGASTTDTGSYAVSVLNTSDQVTVTATVPAIFTLALSGTSISHGTLTAGTVDTGSVTATIGTNAGSGWVAWVKSNTEYLNSSATGGQILSAGTENDDTPTALSGGTYGWALDVILTQDADGDGTITQDPGYGDEYDGNGTSGCSGSTTGGYISDVYRALAQSDGTSDNEQLELCSLLRVPAYQEAATDYTATLTFTAAGRF